MKNAKKKWRSLKAYPLRRESPWLRKILLMALAVQLIWAFSQSWGQALWSVERHAAEYRSEEADEWVVWGIRIRWEDGKLDLYRYEQQVGDGTPINTYN